MASVLLGLMLGVVNGAPNQQTLKGGDEEEEPPKSLRTGESATGRSGDPGAEAAWIPVL